MALKGWPGQPGWYNGPGTAAAVTGTNSPIPAPVWHIRITERDGKGSVLGYMGEAVPTPAGGGGGYENVAMPKSGAVTVWRGKPDLTYSFEIIFSKFLTEESVMDDVAELWAMFSPDPPGPPPIVKINAAGKLTPFERVDWWIDDLEWGDAEANNEGDRTLQRMTVHLTEYRPDVQLSRTRRNQWPAMVIVKTKTMTLSWIAKKYKVPGGWKAIGKIQRPPITDPRKVKVGQHIRMP